jgi:hypothetical protein
LDSGDASANGDKWEYDEDEDLYTIFDGCVVKVSSKSTGSRIVVAGGASATVTLDNVGMDTSAALLRDEFDDEAKIALRSIPIALKSGASLQIKLSGVSEITAGEGGAGIYVPVDAEVSLTSAAGDGETGGALTVLGGYGGAAIGGGYYSPGGAVTISGGTVNATGGLGAAGIGAGYGSSNYLEVEEPGGDITLYGGIVQAKGGDGGAGIGGGETRGWAAPDIYIRGGVVYAIGGGSTTEGEEFPGDGGGGAGIGGGRFGPAGRIEITGGKGFAAVIFRPGWGAGCPVGPGVHSPDMPVEEQLPGGSFLGPNGESDWPTQSPYEWSF